MGTSTFLLMPCATLEEMRSEGLNYYEVLEVAQDASQDRIFEAYQKARQTFSLKNPDIYKVFSPSEAQAWVELIEEAYSVIGFPNTRRNYDKESKSLFEPQLPNLEFSSESKNTHHQMQDQVEPNPLPEGYGETKISRYEKDSKIEEQIEKQEVFDGIFLKKIREYKNIELTEFSSHTCIAIRHLYAIENNNFSVLPAPVFVRGYIIQYCRTLGIDEKRVVPSFMNLLKDV